MKTKLLNHLALALALCFAGTVSAQDAAPAAPAAEPAPAAAEAAAAPAAEAAAATMEAPAAPAADAAVATGRIIFFRPKKFAGAAIKFKVREGERVHGKLGSGTFFTVDLPAGVHEFYAKSEGADDALTLEVEAGETYYVQGTISMGMFAGNGNLAPSDQAAFDEANEKELRDVTGQDVE